MLSPPFFLKLLRSMPKNILNTILSFWLHFTYVAIYKNVKRFWWILYFSNSSFLAFQKCNVKSPCSIQWGKAGEKKVILLLASQHSRWLCCVNFNPCTTCMVHVCLYNIHIAPFQKSSKNFGKISWLSRLTLDLRAFSEDCRLNLLLIYYKRAELWYAAAILWYQHPRCWWTADMHIKTENRI